MTLSRIRLLKMKSNLRLHSVHAGVIPFIALSPPVAASLPLVPAELLQNAALLQVAYGASIASFLGGIHWAMAMAEYGGGSLLHSDVTSAGHYKEAALLHDHPYESLLLCLYRASMMVHLKVGNKCSASLRVCCIACRQASKHADGHRQICVECHPMSDGLAGCRNGPRSSITCHCFSSCCRACC